MQTLIQVVPGGPVETFSDKPMCVNGVKITPTWPWSNKYRAEVRVEMAKVKKCPLQMAQEYRRWYAAK